MKNVHLVFGTGIRTHDLQNTRPGLPPLIRYSLSVSSELRSFALFDLFHFQRIRFCELMYLAIVFRCSIPFHFLFVCLFCSVRSLFISTGFAFVSLLT